MQAKQKITIEVIESKEFRVAAKGYDQREVDEFLDSICDEMENMEAQMNKLQRELEMARQQPIVRQAAPVPVAAPASDAPTADTFREILEMAYRVKEQTIADAQKQAAQIVDSAKAEIKALEASIGEYRTKLEALIKASQDVLAQTEF